MKKILINALLFCAISVFAFGEDGDRPDYWIYQKTAAGVAIFYNGSPIKFLPDVGGGAFDRPINISPKRRYIMLDAQLTLIDATGLVSFWRSLDPKTPMEFVVVIDGEAAYRFVSKFERVTLPASIVETLARIGGPNNADEPKPSKGNPEAPK